MEKKTTTDAEELDRLYELMHICNDVNKPNAKARAEMKDLIKKGTAYKELLQQQNGLYSIALKNRVEAMSASDTFKEVILVKCSHLRKELGHATANPLEKLAIEQIVLCWLNHHKTELQHANILSQSHSIETGIYWEKRLAFASRRYERAMELLSKMRKMNLIVQVNNATNQIISNGNS